jgi:hypothetical protein
MTPATRAQHRSGHLNVAKPLYLALLFIGFFLGRGSNSSHLWFNIVAGGKAEEPLKTLRPPPPPPQRAQPAQLPNVAAPNAAVSSGAISGTAEGSHILHLKVTEVASCMLF